MPNTRAAICINPSDITGIINFTKLSDGFVMQDFYQSEFRLDPVPDNVVAVAKTDPFYSLTAIARYQVNDFFETTERLPEVVLDIKRHALFGGPIFYEGETGIGDLHRAFAEGSGFEDYRSTRIDTFHQLLYPNTYFGWLSIVPRVGFRATYYDETVDLGKTMFTPSSNPLVPDFILPDPTFAHPFIEDGSVIRTVFDTGAEASFKISRTWEDVQSRAILGKFCSSIVSSRRRSCVRLISLSGLPSMRSPARRCGALACAIGWKHGVTTLR